VWWENIQIGADIHYKSLEQMCWSKKNGCKSEGKVLKEVEQVTVKWSNKWTSDRLVGAMKIICLLQQEQSSSGHEQQLYKFLSSDFQLAVSWTWVRDFKKTYWFHQPRVTWYTKLKDSTSLEETLNSRQRFQKFLAS
jgi:hypothetical protein